MSLVMGHDEHELLAQQLLLQQQALDGSQPDMQLQQPSVPSAALVPQATLLNAAASTGSGPLRVFPPVIEFDDVRPGLQFVLTFAVQNASTQGVRRVRITPPVSKLFSIQYTPLPGLAPGLEVQAQVYFQLPGDADDDDGASAVELQPLSKGDVCEYRDKIVISTGSSTVQVPVVARVPAADIQFDEYINFGTVPEGQKADARLLLSNVGSRAGKFRITCPHPCPLSFSPKEGVIKAGRPFKHAPGAPAAPAAQPPPLDNTAIVCVEFDAKRWNNGHALRCAVTLEVEGSPPRLIDVCAVVARQQLVLLGGGGASRLESASGGACASVTELDFGPVFYGGASEVVTVLHNNGPNPTTYAAAVHVDTADANWQQMMQGVPSLAGGGAGAAGGQADAAAGAQQGGAAAGKSGAPSPAPPQQQPPQSAPQPPPPSIPAFSIEPRQSTIPPNGQQAIRVRYTPVLPERTRGFAAAGGDAAAAAARQARNFAATLVIENVELKEDSVKVALAGRAVVPCLAAVPHVLRFGACPTYERRDILVTLTNKGELAAVCKLAAPAHFRASPPHVTVDPGGTARVVVTFVPTQLGTFKGVVHVTPERAAAAPLELRVVGRCDGVGERRVMVGGIDKLPPDFAPKFNFVKSQAAADVRLAATLAKLHPWKRPDPLDETDLLTTNSWDASTEAARVQRQRDLGATLAGPAASDSRLTCSVQELARRAAHRHAYGAWLAAARTKRESAADKQEKGRRAALARRNPDDPENGPDAGFERALEEDAPMPELPPELLRDTLHLLQPLQGTADGKDAGSAAGGAKTHLHRATRYKAQPSSQAEVRDCAVAISPGALATALELSERVLELGAVTSGAASGRALHVTNRLPHAVRFELIGGTPDGKARERVPPEMDGTGPPVQIIPSGGCALVDVALCMRAPKETCYRRQVYFSLNGSSSGACKFTVTALIQPLALTIAPSSLSLEFPMDSRDTVLRHPIMLHNSGTMKCEYAWGSHSKARGSAFRVEPESGTVAPGAKAAAEVVWAPQAGHKPTDKLLLSVAGGADSELVVEGKVEEARCSFSLPSGSGGASGTGAAAAAAAAPSGDKAPNAAPPAAGGAGAGGPRVGIVSSAKEAALSAVVPTLDFGTAPVGAKRVRAVRLTNTGKCPTAFAVEGTAELSEAYGITVYPLRGRLEPRESMELTVTLHPLHPLLLNGVHVGAVVRGGRVARLALSGEALLPDVGTSIATPAAAEPETAVVLSPRLAAAAPELGFGTLAIGAKDTMTVVVQNRAVVAAMLMVDLTAHPEFAVSPVGITDAPLPEVMLPAAGDGDGGAAAAVSYSDAMVTESCIERVREPPTTADTAPHHPTGAGKTRTGSIASRGSLGSAAGNGPPASGSRGTLTKGGATTVANTAPPPPPPEVRKWRVVVAPGASLPVSITFEPRSPGAHDFSLPLAFEFVAAAPYLPADMAALLARATAALQPRVTAAATVPALHLSTPVLDFGERIVNRDVESKATYQAQVSLRNGSARSLAWCLDDASLRADADPTLTPVFYVSPTSGELAPGEETFVRCTFVPRWDATYEAVLPLHLTGSVPAAGPDGVVPRPYLKLGLRGAGVYPRLSFSCDEVVLPVVPLGIPARARFYVVNQGFADLDITYRLPQQCPQGLEVEFPDGRSVGVGRPHLLVEATFTSQRPASFTVPFDVFDSEGGQYTITITGCADNCVLTTWPFLDTNGGAYEYHARAGKSVQLMTRAQISAADARDLAARQLRHSRSKSNRNTLGMSLSAAARAAHKAAAGGDHGASPLDGPSAAAAAAVVHAQDPDLETALPIVDLTFPRPPPLSKEAAAALAQAANDNADAPVQRPKLVAAPVYGALDARGAEVLAEWLSANAVLSQRVDTFPGSLVESNGRLAVEALETMSGKKVPGQAWAKLAKAKTPAERASLLYGQYASMLAWLRERGCLLGGVKAEGLLSRADCIRVRAGLAPIGKKSIAGGPAADGPGRNSGTSSNVVKPASAGTAGRPGSGQPAPLSPKAAALRDEKSGDWWDTHSMQAWSCVLFQAIRVFMLARVTPKALAAMPMPAGMSVATLAQQPSAASSFHNTSEGTSSAAGLARAPPPARQTKGGRAPASEPPPAAGAPPAKVASIPDVTGSNVFSVGECILLKWVTALSEAVAQALHQASIATAAATAAAAAGGASSAAGAAAAAAVVANAASHSGSGAGTGAARAAPVHERITNFRNGFADGTALGRVLRAHAPHLADALWKEPGEMDDPADGLATAVRGLGTLRCGMGVSEEDISEGRGGGRDALLLLLHLFQALPQLVPKTTIEFKAALGASACKSIEIKNPSERAIQYEVSLEGAGAGDFKAHSTRLHIEAGATAEIVVDLVRARFAAPIEARLTCWALRGDKGGMPAASTMVFLLRSRVDSVQPQEKYTATGTCYEQSHVDIHIANPFAAEPAESADDASTGLSAAAAHRFSLELKQEMVAPHAALAHAISKMQQAQRPRTGAAGAPRVSTPHGLGGAAGPGSPGGAGAMSMSPSKGSLRHSERSGGRGTLARGSHGNGSDVADPLVAEVLDALKCPFFATASMLIIPSRGKGTLRLNLLPFAPGTYSCTVMLRHDKLGEFAVAVTATVGLPNPTRAPVMTVTPEAGLVTAMQRELRVPSKNMALTAAITLLVERYQGDARTKARATLAKYSNHFGPESSAATSGDGIPLTAAAVPYAIKIDSPFLQPLRDDILIMPEDAPAVAAARRVDGSGGGGAAAAAAKAAAALPKAVELCAPGSSGGASLATNIALLTFTPSAAGSYPATAVIACATPYMMDVRCYEVKAVVTPPSVITELMFRCPAGQKIVQQVPVHNSSDVDWFLVASPRPPPPFSGPPNIKVAAKSSAFYPIAYAPLQPTPAPPAAAAKDVPPLDFSGALGGSGGSGNSSRAQTASAAAAAAVGDTGKLVLCDEKSLGKPVSIEFVLRGTAEEPLAEEHRVISCAARQSQTARFVVRNVFSRQIAYRVETDLPGVSGASTISVPPKGEGTYDLVVCPPFGGTFTGSLTFTPQPPPPPMLSRNSVVLPGGGSVGVRPSAFAAPPQSGGGSTVGTASVAAAAVAANALEGCCVWYTIEVQATTPKEEDTIEVRTPLRTALGVEISLSNPLGEHLEFEVLLNGEGVMGEPSFSLPPLESGTYTVYYTPLRAGSFEGSVTFANVRVGEFWYKLMLEAEAAQPVALPPLCAPVGSSASVAVDIDNPTGQVITLEASISNKRNFVVVPAQITLAPFAAGSATVVYTPSSIGEPETADIILRPTGKHPPLGDWAYSAAGTGALPGVMEEHRPVSTVGEVASYTFAFRNPFPHPLLVDIVLREGGDTAAAAAAAHHDATPPRLATGGIDGAVPATPLGGGGGGGGEAESPPAHPLALLLKRTAGVVLAPFASLQVPLAFSPTVITDSLACLEVRGAPVRSGTAGLAASRGPLTWVYPVRGVAEAPAVVRAFSLTTAAKTSIRRDVEVVLRGLTDVLGQETFEYQVVLPPAPPPDASGSTVQAPSVSTGRVSGAAEAAAAAAAAAATGQRLAERALTVAALQTTISHAREPLRFQLAFEPLRPFTASAELVVVRRSGGRWRFGISLIASDAAPDDRFEIQAPVGGAASVALRLCNRYLAYAPFQAYFTPDSSLSLSVEPTDGVLSPFGTEGTQLTVTYAPKQYSPGQRGRLVVCTDDVQWSYEVLGTFPDVKSIANVTSRVDTNLAGGSVGRRGAPGGGGSHNGAAPRAHGGRS